MAESQVSSCEGKVDFDADTVGVMSRGQVPSHSDNKLNFSDGTLRAIAKLFLACRAIYFYMERIQVDSTDIQLQAKLHSSQATANFYLGNYQEALHDATSAIKLEPTCIEPIEIGASACVQLQCYEDAIFWWKKGLAIDKNSKTLLDLWARCVKDKNKSQETKRPKMKNKLLTHAVKDEESKTSLPKISKDVSDKTEEGTWHGKVANSHDNTAGEGCAYGNLGCAYHRLGHFKKAIEYHELHLKIAKEVRDAAGEGGAYGNLGNDYHSLGDFKKAMEYHERHLKIAKEVGDTAGEGRAYGNLGNAYQSLGDFKKAIEYHERHLKIAKEVGDTAGAGRTYSNLGNAYHSLGDFKKAIEYHERHLIIAKEVGDTAGKGCAYGNLGCAYDSLEDFKKAIEYHERHLKIAKEVGDMVGEGCAYGNLGNAYHSLGDFRKAMEYHKRPLKIAKEVGDTAGEGCAYGNLGNAYQSLGDFKKAIEYHKRHLKIAKEVGDREEEAMSFYRLGQSLESEGMPLEALDCCRSSVRVFNDVRHLMFRDVWKISYRDMYNCAYTSLWRLYLKQGNVLEALFAAEQGRAQALQDLMTLRYASETAHEITYDAFSCLPSNTVFMAIDKREIIFWSIRNGIDVHLRRQKIGGSSSEDVATTVAESLIHSAYGTIGVRGSVKCEDRSLDKLSHKDLPNKKCNQTISELTEFDTNPLRALYDVIIGPIFDLIHGNDLILVPEGPLCLAPYAAFLDCNSQYLYKAFKIRLIPSLSSLKLITDCTEDYHKKSGALLVGDPCLEEVLYQGKRLMQLPGAKAEVEMIGKILHTTPLTGKEATKYEVLKRLPSVALVHIAAHGRMETGEIALAPNTSRTFQIPNEEDFLLTMKDVLSVQLRARLVVLSCCHSGRGEIKAEGVVGIARAFMGAGARSVLVSLWAIDDEATLEFMKNFYQHLAEGRSANEALNRAMKCMRDSDEFKEVKYWAPFVLIGDDVTLDLDEAD
ncbi:uncharacterized protein LOC144663549 [Oculina patagonica]